MRVAPLAPPLAAAAFVLAALAACGDIYLALPSVDAGVDATVDAGPPEALACTTYRLVDLPVRFRCSTNGLDDADCSGAGGHSAVTVDRAGEAVAGSVVYDTKGPSAIGRAYAVFTVPGAPRKVTLDYDFAVTNRSAATMNVSPGCSYGWDDGERTNNLDIDILRTGVMQLSYYREGQGGGATQAGLPVPARAATFTAHMEVSANATASRAAVEVREGQVSYVRAEYVGQPPSTQGTLTEFLPTTYSLYCGMILADGDGTAMRATGTVYRGKVEACYRVGEVPPPPSQDAGVPADASPSDGGPG